MLFNILSVVRIVLLGLWVGAMAGFAFLFAPEAFAHIGPTPAFASTIAASVRAIAVAGYVLGGLAIAVTLFLPEPVRRKLFVVVSIVVAFVCTVVETQAIVPKMETTPLLTAAYESLHRASSGVYSAVLIFALLATVVSAWGRGPRYGLDSN